MITCIHFIHIKNLTAIKDNHVDRLFSLFGKLDHVERNAHIPVPLGRAVAALNERLQLHFKTDRLQDGLKLIE